jgi:hypothetical protein
MLAKDELFGGSSLSRQLRPLLECSRIPGPVLSWHSISVIASIPTPATCGSILLETATPGLVGRSLPLRWILSLSALSSRPSIGLLVPRIWCDGHASVRILLWWLKFWLLYFEVRHLVSRIFSDRFSYLDRVAVAPSPFPSDASFASPSCTVYSLLLPSQALWLL